MKRERNLLITKLILQGYTITSVAEVFHLSKPRVKEILKRICSEHMDVGQNDRYLVPRIPHTETQAKAHIKNILKHKNRMLASINKELGGGVDGDT